jgi:hypothetical protein
MNDILFFLKPDPNKQDWTNSTFLFRFTREARTRVALRTDASRAGSITKVTTREYRIAVSLMLPAGKVYILWWWFALDRRNLLWVRILLQPEALIERKRVY